MSIALSFVQKRQDKNAIKRVGAKYIVCACVFNLLFCIVVYSVFQVLLHALGVRGEVDLEFLCNKTINIS